MEDVRTCLRLGRPQKLPVFMPSPPFDVRILGMSYEEYATDVKKMIRCHTEAIKRVDYDWAFCMSIAALFLSLLG